MPLREPVRGGSSGSHYGPMARQRRYRRGGNPNIQKITFRTTRLGDQTPEHLKKPKNKTPERNLLTYHDWSHTHLPISQMDFRVRQSMMLLVSPSLIHLLHAEAEREREKKEKEEKGKEERDTTGKKGANRPRTPKQQDKKKNTRNRSQTLRSPKPERIADKTASRTTN